MAMYDYDRTDWEIVQKTLDLHSHEMQKKPSVEEMAENACVSARELHRVFSQIAADSPAKACRRLSLRQAAGLLAHSDKSIEDIAFEAGFKTVAGFDKAFRREYIASPTHYRNAFRDPQPQWHVVYDTSMGCTTYTFGVSGPIACERPPGATMPDTFESLRDFNLKDKQE